MKKIFYLTICAFIAVTVAGGFACIYSVFEKYNALSSLQALNNLPVNVLYSVFPFF